MASLLQPLLALAAGASGLSSEGGAVVQQEAQFLLQLPQAFAFSEQKAAPLLDVQVGSAVPAPEAGSDAMLALSLDPQRRLHLHLSGPKSAPVDSTWVTLASAEYRNTVKQNGWGYLSVRTTEEKQVSEDLKMYAAGFLEGYSSALQIKNFQFNANALIKKDETNHEAMGNIESLFEKEIANICKMAGLAANGTVLESASAPKDAWWRHARLMLLQGWGILDAYNQHAEKMDGTRMSMVDLLILNSDGETPELEMAYDFQEVALRQATRECGDCDSDDNSTDSTAFLQRRSGTKRLRGGALMPESGRELISKARARRKQVLRDLDDKAWRKIKEATGRCSALIRLASNSSDIFVGHTTFSDYSEMNRIWKFYDFPLTAAASRRMGFSSYPGVVGSTDDYYVLDTGLVVTETTVSMLSDEAFDHLDDNGTFVPDYMRIMLANRLAKTGKDWVDFMVKSATGTYNSQWMVVDYNLFTPGERLKDGTLWVLEQAPGVSKAEDATSTLQTKGFWSSENRAAFAAVRNVSGEMDAEDVHGKLFSADHNPRANIFAATAPAVQTLAEMRGEMQRNRWPHEVDGGPGNTPDHAIAARGDLDKTSPTPNGGVDSKVTNRCLAMQLAADAIAGPTHDGQAPFKWTDANGKNQYPDYPHDGLPDLWNFDWVRFSPGGEGAAASGCNVGK